MLNKEQKNQIKNIVGGADFQKLLKDYKKAEKLSQTTTQQARDAYNAWHNFYFYERPQESPKDRDAWEKWHDKEKELLKNSNDLEITEKVNKHNKDILKANILRYFANCYILPNWWELYNKKGLESVGEYLQELTGLRFAIYRDFGGSISYDKTKSYYYAYFYIDGFRLWLALSENRGQFGYLKTITLKQYLKIKSKYLEIEKELKTKHEQLREMLGGACVRDLLGNYEIKLSSYKLGD